MVKGQWSLQGPQRVDERTVCFPLSRRDSPSPQPIAATAAGQNLFVHPYPSLSHQQTEQRCKVVWKLAQASSTVRLVVRWLGLPVMVGVLLRRVKIEAVVKLVEVPQPV